MNYYGNYWSNRFLNLLKTLLKNILYNTPDRQDQMSKALKFLNLSFKGEYQSSLKQLNKNCINEHITLISMILCVSYNIRFI